MRDSYKLIDELHKSSPWYKDWHTYVYIAFGLAGTLCLAGTGMFLYAVISERGFFLPTNVPRPDADANPQPDGNGVLHLIKSVVRAFPNTWTLPILPIASLNPINIVTGISNSLRTYTGNLTQTEVNAQEALLMEQRSRNVFMEDVYPFTPVIPNEPLALKVYRYFNPENEESRAARANHMVDLYKAVGYDMEDRTNVLTASAYRQIKLLTGCRIKTDSEMLAQRFNTVPETPVRSPVDLPPTGSGGEAGPSNPLSENALREHDSESLFNKPIGPLSDKTQADIDEAKSAFGGSSEGEDGEDVGGDEPQFEETQTTPMPVNKGKGVIRAAVQVASALSGVELEPDDDLSATIKPQESAPVLNPAQNPYPYGTTAYYQWSPVGIPQDDTPTTPTPKSTHRKPLKPSPLNFVRKTSRLVGDSHSSEGEGDVS